MEEKILKQILDVVTDIKADQKIMRNEMNDMKTEINDMKTDINGKIDKLEAKVDKLEIKVDKLTTEQIIMKEEIRDIKTETKLLSFKVTTLMKEQEGTKFAVGACVQKIR